MTVLADKTAPRSLTDRRTDRRRRLHRSGFFLGVCYVAKLWIALTLWLIVAMLAYQHAGPWYYNMAESPVEASK